MRFNLNIIRKLSLAIGVKIIKVFEKNTFYLFIKDGQNDLAIKSQTDRLNQLKTEYPVQDNSTNVHNSYLPYC